MKTRSQKSFICLLGINLEAITNTMVGQPNILQFLTNPTSIKDEAQAKLFLAQLLKQNQPVGPENSHEETTKTTDSEQIDLSDPRITKALELLKNSSNNAVTADPSKIPQIIKTSFEGGFTEAKTEISKTISEAKTQINNTINATKQKFQSDPKQWFLDFKLKMLETLSTHLNTRATDMETSINALFDTIKHDLTLFFNEIESKKQSPKETKQNEDLLKTLIQLFNNKKTFENNARDIISTLKKAQKPTAITNKCLQDLEIALGLITLIKKELPKIQKIFDTIDDLNKLTPEHKKEIEKFCSNLESFLQKIKVKSINEDVILAILDISNLIHDLAFALQHGIILNDGRQKAEQETGFFSRIKNSISQAGKGFDLAKLQAHTMFQPIAQSTTLKILGDNNPDTIDNISKLNKIDRNLILKAAHLQNTIVKKNIENVLVRSKNQAFSPEQITQIITLLKRLTYSNNIITKLEQKGKFEHKSQDLKRLLYRLHVTIDGLEYAKKHHIEDMDKKFKQDSKNSEQKALTQLIKKEKESEEDIERAWFETKTLTDQLIEYYETIKKHPSQKQLQNKTN